MMDFEEVAKKIQKKWPSLETLMQESKRIKQELYIESLLEPVDHITLDSCSDISEITDPFEEFNKDNHLMKLMDMKKRKKKHETEVHVMDQFTPEFQRIMEDLRQEMKIDKDICPESIEELKEFLRKPIEAKQHENKVTILDIQKNGRPHVKKDETKSKNDERKTSIISSESGIWNILEAHSDPNKFQISPPGYNAFRGQKHWMERPSVSLRQIDDSKVKCEKWLDSF